MSGGDHVETANTETQWNAFLASDKLRQYPWAATIGNHDVGGKAYEQHLWTPNTDRSAPYYTGNPATQSGGDYWYIYKDVLFIDLNSNAYATRLAAATPRTSRTSPTSSTQHGAEAKWTVLVYHHSIYSPAATPTTATTRSAGVDFPTAFSNLGVDLVLPGSRPQLLAQLRDQERREGERRPSSPVPPTWSTGPGGVIYVTGNSASGSKYYDITKPDAAARTFGPDPLDPGQAPLGQLGAEPGARPHLRQGRGAQATSSSSRTSAAAPARLRTRAVEKGLSCVNTAEGQPVGSIVDNVTVHPFHADGQAIQVERAEPGPGRVRLDDRRLQRPGRPGYRAGAQRHLLRGDRQDQPDPRVGQPPLARPVVDLGQRRRLPATPTRSSPAPTWAGPRTCSTAARAPRPVRRSCRPTTTRARASRSPAALGAAAQGHPRGGAKLGADLDLKIPDSIAKGSYRTTLTITALSS